jgi:hypothetical protein
MRGAAANPLAAIHVAGCFLGLFRGDNFGRKLARLTV